jgi:hypothetical protein
LDQELLIEIDTAYKGYDDGNNHYYLEVHDLHSAMLVFVNDMIEVLPMAI